MLKVLYIAPEYPNENKNAAQVRANQLLPRLARSVDLHVLAYSTLDDASGLEEENFSVQVIQPGKPSFLSVLSSSPRAFFRYMHDEARITFINMVKRIQPDIIHFDSIATFGLFKYLKEINLAVQPKVVFHPHDAVSRLYTSRVNSEKNIFLRMCIESQRKKILNVEKNTYPKVNLIMVDSDEDKILLKTVEKSNNIQLLSLGYDEFIYSSEGEGTTLKHPNVLLSGAMGGDQSIDAALRLCNAIMPLVWKKRPDIHVYLVGSSPAIEILALKKQDKRIHVTGFVDDLSVYLRSCDIYVCPLTMGSGMRTRTVEALACGCAMLTSSEGIVGIEPQSNESWLIAESDEDYAKKIIELIQNKNARGMLKRGALLTASQYSWSSVVGKLAGFYEKL